MFYWIVNKTGEIRKFCCFNFTVLIVFLNIALFDASKFQYIWGRRTLPINYPSIIVI